MSGNRELINIPENVMLEVYTHAHKTYPEECCGLLMGPPGQDIVNEVVICENKQNQMHALDPATFKRTAEMAYFFGPDDLKVLDLSLRKGQPRKTRVIYHSHCDVGAYFSASDRAAATMDGEPLYPVTYLVIDANIHGVMGAKQYSWNDKRHDFLLVASYGPSGEHINPRDYV
jgi:proteasome lid subunit RPN8/RPN11